MDDVERERLQHGMQDQGYDVVLNTRLVPAEVAGPMLVYSPGQKSLQRIRQLSAYLQAEGYAVQLVPESVGNNFYTPGNVGLYLTAYANVVQTRKSSAQREEGTVPLAGQEFAGECPGDDDAYLDLAEGWNFTLDLLGWDDQGGTEILESLAGTWSQSGDKVVLHFAAQDFEFKRENFRQQFRVKRGIGYRNVEVEGIRLVNAGTAFGQCDFVQRRQL